MSNSDSSSRKARVIDALRAQTETLLHETTESQKASVASATHEEARAENDKDTRGLETTYLARGLAKRVVELREAKNKLMHLKASLSTTVKLGALVTFEDELEEQRTLFIAPAGGGITVDVDGPGQVVSPQSPLAKALIGKEVDDDATVRTPKGKSEVVIVALE